MASSAIKVTFVPFLLEVSSNNSLFIKFPCSNSAEADLLSLLDSTLKKDVKPIDIKSQVTLKNKEHNLYFNYSVTDFEKLSTSIYQYRLLGLYDSWSNWSPQPKVFFENLPHGDYTFQVRAKVGSKISSNIASYNFSIEKPWYLKTGAIICYVLIFLFTTALIQYFNRDKLE